jgi:hypothetical protein
VLVLLCLEVDFTGYNTYSIMESGSPSANASDQPPHGLADIVGTLIALLTLTAPLFVIAHYSSSNIEVFPPRTYQLPVARD